MDSDSLADRLDLWGVDRAPSDPEMLLDFIEGLAQGQPQPAPAQTLEELESRRLPLTLKLRHSLGLDPWPERTPLNARLTGRMPRQGYTIEKWIYEAWAGLPVTAHLYIPEGLKGPVPAIYWWLPFLPPARQRKHPEDVAPPEPGLRHVRGDGVDPRRKLRNRLVGVPVLVHTNKGLLYDVAALIPIPQEPEDVIRQRVLVTADEMVKCRSIPLLESDNQLLIRLPLKRIRYKFGVNHLTPRIGRCSIMPLQSPRVSATELAQVA